MSQSLGNELEKQPYAVKNPTYSAGLPAKRFHPHPLNKEPYGSAIIEIRNDVEELAREAGRILPHFEKLIEKCDDTRDEYRQLLRSLWETLNSAEQKKIDIINEYQLTELTPGNYIRAPRATPAATVEADYDVQQPGFARDIPTQAAIANKTGKRKDDGQKKMQIAINEAKIVGMERLKRARQD